jgi:hypothetical protein
VLLGDFNMLPGSRCHQVLLANFDDDTPPWRDAWALAQPGQPHAPTVGLHDPDGAPFTFDYAFVSADLATRVRRTADRRPRTRLGPPAAAARTRLAALPCPCHYRNSLPGVSHARPVEWPARPQPPGRNRLELGLSASRSRCRACPGPPTSMD